MSKPEKIPKPENKKTVPFGKQKRWRFFPFRHLIAVGLIAGVALAAYSNTFYVPFQFDDRPNITQNPNIQKVCQTYNHKDTCRRVEHFQHRIHIHIRG